MFRKHSGPAAAAAGLMLALLMASPAGAAAGTTITVDIATQTIADDGHCTLPEAIVAANTNTASGVTPGECPAGAKALDTIAFDPAVHTITLSAELPDITAPVVVDGGAQVELTAGGAVNGLTFGPGSKGSTLKGFKVTGFTSTTTSAGVRLLGGGVTLFNNFLGTPDGFTTNGNGGGVLIASSGNHIGLPGNANVIGANGMGVVVQSGSGNVIQANLIGVSTGGGSLSNSIGGVLVDSAATGTLIGGTGAGQSNLISGNPDGIIINAGARATKIQRNVFGLSIDGQTALSNGEAVSDLGGIGTMVGGAMPASSNLFAGNGIAVASRGTAATSSISVIGNVFGLAADGATAKANGFGIVAFDSQKVIIKTNLITHTTNQGIEFDGPTPQLGKGSTGNCISGNFIGAADFSTNPSPIDLSGNWWGAPTGPNTAGGDTSTGSITTTKWLTKRPASCNGWSATGFKPADSTVVAKSSKPTKFSWGKVAGAGHYDVWLFTFNDYTGTFNYLASGQSVTAPSYPAPLGYGRYYWYVQTVIPGLVDWGSQESVLYVTIMKTPKPGASAPAGAVKFSWGASSPAPAGGTYVWTLYNSPACAYDTTATNVAASVPGLTGLSTTQTVSPPGNYWWSVSPNGGPQMDCFPITITP